MRKPITILEKFDNWFWHGQHAKYYQLVHEPGWNGNLVISKFFRGISLIAIIAIWIITVESNPNPFGYLFVFFTIWGFSFASASVMLSQFFIPGKKAKPLPENVYSPWQLWKWYILIYEIALLCELIVAPYFWALLWQDLIKQDIMKQPLFKATQICVHSIPFSILVLEFIFINWVPVTMRHYSVAFLVTVSYMLTNMITCFVQGSPVYPGMTWDSVGGCILPLGVAVLSMVIFYALSKLSQFRDRKLSAKRNPELKKLLI